MNGVKHFRKSFAYERYFPDPLEGNLPLAHYLRSLELFARGRGQRPFLKYVRSQGRIGWIKQTCGGLHLALVRTCFDQFRSYIWNANRGNLYFFAATCEIFAKNVSVFDAELAAKIVRIRAFSSSNTAEEQVYYQRVAASLTLQQLYFVHAYVWKRQFRHALRAADAIFSIYAPQDRLASFGAFAADNGFKLDFSGVRASRTNGQPAYDERFQRIEALADYCLFDAGHAQAVEPAGGAKRYLDDALEAEAKAAERLAVFGPFERYSPMELLSAVDGGGPDAAAAPSPSPTGPFGAVDIVPALLTVPHRLTGDGDDLLRVEARAMYVPSGAALRWDPIARTYAVVSSQPETSLVGFGPHWVLQPGSYELALNYDATPRPSATAAGANVDIVADYGNIKVLPPTDLPLAGPVVRTFAFEAEESLPAFEVRVTATDASVRLLGYTIRRLSNGHQGAPA